jgi:hypothetical protein
LHIQVSSGSTKNITSSVSRAQKFAGKNSDMTHTSNNSVGTIKIKMNPNVENAAYQNQAVIPTQY